jgi:hypothetical protein
MVRRTVNPITLRQASHRGGAALRALGPPAQRELHSYRDAETPDRDVTALVAGIQRGVRQSLPAAAMAPVNRSRADRTRFGSSRIAVVMRVTRM